MSIIKKNEKELQGYAPYSIDLYNICYHRCDICPGFSSLYCSCRDYKRDTGVIPDIIPSLRKQAASLHRKGFDSEIILSLSGDPYPEEEMKNGLTRKVIEILIQNDMNFAIFTKGGMRAVRDFDLLSGYKQCRFGTSFVAIDQGIASKMEPGADSVENRKDALLLAESMNISTFSFLDRRANFDQVMRIFNEINPIVEMFYYPAYD
jgi:DNA repair photolyase